MLEHMNKHGEAPKRVVVIGSRGVFGAAIGTELETQGLPVLLVSSRDIDLLEDGAAKKLADQLAPGDVVVMLSALTPDRGRDIKTFMKNLRMAEAVCAALEEVPPAHVVYISSDAVYPMVEGLVSEESSAEPHDLYGVMHCARELMFQQLAGKVPLAILRCTLVLSHRDTHNSYGPNRFRCLSREKGEIVLGGEGEETRDHILDADVARLVVQVVKRRSHGVLNLASGTSHSFREVAEMVAACFKPSAIVKGSIRNAPVTHRRFDVKALHEAFPEFRFTPLDEAIRKTHAKAEQG